jgi:Succinylglutamate desuccinylase / Aspartoacylase family
MHSASDHVAVTELPRLSQFDRFANALLGVPASDLWRHLQRPSLFHISGRQAAPLFVTVLLHGNEDTGWQAIQAVLRRHQGMILPRSLLLFVGNIEAAKANARKLPQQEDYNRTWPGTMDANTPVARLMCNIVEVVRRNGPFASIDIHNNTGHNPHYACVSSLQESHLHLARLFSRTVVYFEKPVGVQSAALAEICPAVTVEWDAPARRRGCLTQPNSSSRYSRCNVFPIIQCLPAISISCRHLRSSKSRPTRAFLVMAPRPTFVFVRTSIT